MKLRRVSVMFVTVFLSGCAGTRTTGPIVAERTELAPRGRSVLTMGHEAAPTADSAGERLRVHFVKIGQGDCILVCCPNGKTVLVDCGSSHGFSTYRERKVRKYLRNNLDPDEPKIDLLVVTHPDSDHYDRIPVVLAARGSQKEIEVDRVMLVRGDFSYSRGGFDSWLAGFGDDHIEDVTEEDYNTTKPRAIPGFGEVKITILAADVPASRSVKNAKSIVLLVDYGNVEILLTGDATDATQKNMLERFGADAFSNIEILKVAHHGSKATSMVRDTASGKTSPWFEAVAPEMVVFTVARMNDYGHPSADVAAALEDYTIEAPRHRVKFYDKQYSPSDSATNRRFREEAMFMTSTNGNIIVTTDGEEYELTWAN